jgi:hypothetical protein
LRSKRIQSGDSKEQQKVAKPRLAAEHAVRSRLQGELPASAGRSSWEPSTPNPAKEPPLSCELPQLLEQLIGAQPEYSLSVLRLRSKRIQSGDSKEQQKVRGAVQGELPASAGRSSWEPSTPNPAKEPPLSCELPHAEAEGKRNVRRSSSQPRGLLLVNRGHSLMAERWHGSKPR